MSTDMVLKTPIKGTTITGFDPAEYPTPIDITFGDMNPVSVRVSYTMEQVQDFVTALNETLEYCQELQQETEQAAAHAERPS